MKITEMYEALKALEECVSGMDQSTLDDDFEKALAKARLVLEEAKPPPPPPLPPTCKHCKSNFTSGGVVELCQFHRAADEMMQALEIAEEAINKAVKRERFALGATFFGLTGAGDSIRAAMDRARGKL